MSMYHWEADQEDFLVLSGEALLIVEGEERPLRAWDFVHTPAKVEHTIVGAGDGPCVIVAVGARVDSVGPNWGAYPVNETALRHNAGVERGDDRSGGGVRAVPAARPDALPGGLAALAFVERRAGTRRTRCSRRARRSRRRECSSTSAISSSVRPLRRAPRMCSASSSKRPSATSAVERDAAARAAVEPRPRPDLAPRVARDEVLEVARLRRSCARSRGRRARRRAPRGGSACRARARRRSCEVREQRVVELVRALDVRRDARRAG